MNILQIKHRHQKHYQIQETDITLHKRPFSCKRKTGLFEIFTGRLRIALRANAGIHITQEVNSGVFLTHGGDILH